MKRRIYTDTSVIGGCLDDEFSEGSIALFDCFRSGSALIVLSNLTLAELEAAPAKVQAVIKTVPTDFIDYVEFTQDASELEPLLRYCGMKIEAVKMMREIREKMSADIKDMTWAEEEQYLMDRLTVFSDIPNRGNKG